MAGIIDYGAYLPGNVVTREEMGRVLGDRSGTGVRSTAGADEDTTTMAVAAVRALAASTERARTLWLATTTPAYRHKTNATTVHAAAGLPPSMVTGDLGSSLRSAAAGFQTTLEQGGLLVVSDRWTGRPGSPEERAGGDAAAALLFGDQDELASVEATASRSVELLDWWQLPDEPEVRTWDERFAPTVLLPVVDDVLAELAAGGMGTPDHAVVVSPNPRVRRAVEGRLPADRLAPSLDEQVGFCGAAHLGLVLADLLDRAEPGQVLLVLQVTDGVDAIVLRATERLPSRRQQRSVRAALEGRRQVSYPTFLTWTGRLERQPPRRPDPQGPAAPPSVRNEAWKFRLVATRCEDCSMVHAPPARVCQGCGSVDRMVDAPLADRLGTVATMTVDRLAYSLDPPVNIALIDVDGGGRLACEIADVDPGEIGIGDRVSFTFRRLITADGVHDYFYKARPVGGRAGAG